MLLDFFFNEADHFQYQRLYKIASLVMHLTVECALGDVFFLSSVKVNKTNKI